MPKEQICERIYKAFKIAAGDHPEVGVRKGVHTAARMTSMSPKLVAMWMESMEETNMIDCDGRTIWLVADHGPRVQRPDEWAIQHQKELDAMKRADAERKARLREIRKAERGRKRAKRGK